jgi:hypothetical protein
MTSAGQNHRSMSFGITRCGASWRRFTTGLGAGSQRLLGNYCDETNPSQTAVAATHPGPSRKAMNFLS